MTYWTEDRIERQVELKFNALDRRLMRGLISQAEYDELAKCIAAWADAEYERIATFRSLPPGVEAYDLGDMSPADLHNIIRKSVGE